VLCAYRDLCHRNAFKDLHGPRTIGEIPRSELSTKITTPGVGHAGLRDPHRVVMPGNDGVEHICILPNVSLFRGTV
jgi:hypothetical protein